MPCVYTAIAPGSLRAGGIAQGMTLVTLVPQPRDRSKMDSDASSAPMPGPSSVCSLASAVGTSGQLGPNIHTAATDETRPLFTVSFVVCTSQNLRNRCEPLRTNDVVLRGLPNSLRPFGTTHLLPCDVAIAPRRLSTHPCAPMFAGRGIR